MLRGFRWQTLAFVLALILFSASIITRSQQSPPSQTTTTAPTPAATFTPQPVAINPTPSPFGNDEAVPASGRFREGLVGSVARLNPVFATLNPVDQDITRLIFEGLVRTNAYGEPVPALAQNWVVSSDGLEYVFTLRNDVLWQDGLPFTSADVAYTMNILRAADFPAEDNSSEFWRTIETEILNETQVRFRLTQPLGAFLERMQIGMLPEHALRGTNAAQLASHPFNLTPIGTGAYQLEQIITDANGEMSAVLLRAAPTYRLRPEGQNISPIERIEFRLFADFGAAAAALQATEIDGLAGRTRTERQRLLDTTSVSAAVNLYTQIEPTLGVLIYNWERENLRLFRDQRVRVALQQGLTRASIIDRNLSSLAVPANSPLIPGSWAYLANLPWAAFDPGAAQQLISEALGGIATPTPSPDQTVEPPQPVSFTILVPDDPLLATIVQEITTQWSQLGLMAMFISEDETTYRQRLESGDFDAALIEYSLGSTADPDVYTFWHESQLPPDGLNYGGAVDRRISELIERARREASGINRIQLYQEFQRVFAERAIAIPLYYPLFSYSVSSQVSGIQLGVMGNLSDRFRNITEWQFIPAS